MKDVYDAIVLSPGPGTPACESDIGICKDIPESCVDVPILGICLGHQALAHAHGARIVKALPFHGRLSKVVLAPPPPAAALNSQQREKYALLENILLSPQMFGYLHSLSLLLGNSTNHIEDTLCEPGP